MLPTRAPATAPIPPGLARLVADGTFDASVAALAWVLLESGIPVLVAGREPVVRAAIVAALLDAMPEGRRAHPGHVVPGRVVLVAGGVGPTTPPGVLRAALATTTARSGLVASVEADDLQGVLGVLGAQGLTADEVSFMGVVVVLGDPAAEDGPPRVVAAHYLRPVVRDAGGHTRRLPPAILAARTAAGADVEDFAWGVMPDLAERAGMQARDLERERDRRAALLAGGHRAPGALGAGDIG